MDDTSSRQNNISKTSKGKSGSMNNQQRPPLGDISNFHGHPSNMTTAISERDQGCAQSSVVEHLFSYVREDAAAHSVTLSVGGYSAKGKSQDSTGYGGDLNIFLPGACELEGPAGLDMCRGIKINNAWLQSMDFRFDYCHVSYILLPCPEE